MRPTAVAIVLALLVGAKLYQIGSAPEVPAGAAGPVQLPNDWRAAWALDFLAACGNPQPSAEIVAFVVEWTLAEDSGDGARARNNPLNTTQTGYGETASINGDGVKAYPSYENGLAATVHTITNGRYGELLAGLQTNDYGRAFNGLISSPWAAGSYNGGADWPRVQLNAPPAAAPAGQKCLPTQAGTVGANYYSTGDVWASLGQPGGMHLGTDYLGDPGTVVYAPLPFVVEAVGSYSDPRTAGVYVQGRFDDGYLFYSGHLAEAYVSAGQRVAACQPIGVIGELAHTHIKVNPPGAPEPCEGSGACEDFEAYIAAR